MNNDNKEQKKEQTPDMEVFEKLLKQKYAATKDLLSGEATFRSSRELQHEFEEYCEPTVADISLKMLELGYEYKKGFWQVFPLEPEDE